jgi:hypothetical protein
VLIDVVLATAGALGLAVAALSARLRRLPVSEPVLALAAGVLIRRGERIRQTVPLDPSERRSATPQWSG